MVECARSNKEGKKVTAAVILDFVRVIGLPKDCEFNLTSRVVLKIWQAKTNRTFNVYQVGVGMDL